MQYFVTRGVVVVTTSTKKENLAKLVATEKLRDLTPDEVQEIEEVGKKIHFRGYREHMTVDFPEPDLPNGAHS